MYKDESTAQCGAFSLIRAPQQTMLMLKVSIHARLKVAALLYLQPLTN
jgi:hypothetical protein